MLSTIALIVGIVWVLWRFISTGNLRHLFAVIALGELAFSRWPLFLPMQFSFAALAFTAVGFMIYENYYKKNLQNASLTYIYLLLFIVFGFFFLADGWLSFHKA